MLVGAFASAAAATFTGSVWLGLLAGAAAAVVFSLIHGYASIDQRANQIVSGTAINMVADGLTALIGNAIWSQGGRTPQLPAEAQFGAINWPFVNEDRRRAHHRADLSAPHFGPRHHDLHRVPAWCRSPIGRSTARASACVCARSARIRPRSTPPAFRCAALRYSAVIICGVLVGLAGVYLVLVAGRLFPAAHERRAKDLSRLPRSSSPNGGHGRRWPPAFCSASSTRWRSACRASNCRSSDPCRCRRSKPCLIF